MSRRALLMLLIVIALVAGAALWRHDARRAKEPVAGTGWREPRTGMEFVWVPSGCFRMGFPDVRESGSHADREAAQPEHEVCMRGFYLGRYEVTQAQYRQVTGANPSRFTQSPQAPVDGVRWRDAVAMATSLDATGRIRLPSEAEWEYACRAGGQHVEVCGDAPVDDLAWVDTLSNHGTQPVGKKKPNAWGLYDMNGNVWELTLDCWNPNYQHAPADGSAWREGDCGHHVKRGGGWNNYASVSSSTERSWADGEGVVIDNQGFRLVYAP